MAALTTAAATPSALLEEYLAVQEAKRPAATAAAWWREPAKVASPHPPTAFTDASPPAPAALAVLPSSSSSCSPTADALERYDRLLAECVAQLEADGIQLAHRACRQPELAAALLMPPGARLQRAPSPTALPPPTTLTASHVPKAPRSGAARVPEAPKGPAAPSGEPPTEPKPSTVVSRSPLSTLDDPTNLPTTKRKLNAFRRFKNH